MKAKCATVVLAFLFIPILFLVACDKPTEPEDIPIEANLYVASSPSGAAIYINGVDTEQFTPHTFNDMTTRKCNIRLVMAGFYDYSTNVVLQDNWTTVVNADLILLPILLIVTSEPDSLEIFMDYESTGLFTPAEFSDLWPGGYNLRLTHPGYFPWDTDFEISRGDTLVFNAVLEPAPDYKIYFSSGPKLLVVGCDGYTPRTIADNCRNIIGSVVCSPDYQSIAYASPDGIAIIDSSGTPIDLLSFSSSTRATDFSWSLDSRYLVFGAYTDGIYRYDRNTGQLVKIFDTSGFRYDHNPVYSLDDSRIAFIHHTYESHARIYLMDADGNNVQQAAHEVRTKYDENLQLTWVSNEELLLRTNRDSNKGVYYLNFEHISDSLATPILIFPEFTRSITLSPNLSYYAITTNGNAAYYNEVGSWTPILLHDPSGHGGYSPSWSPASNAIAFGTLSSLFWITLQGDSYRILNPLDYTYILGLSVSR